jgi:hypothetical protein
MRNNYTIGEAADMLGVGTKTLRRWDESGELKPTNKSEKGHRYYSKNDIINYLKKFIFEYAEYWVKKEVPEEPLPLFYCSDIYIFKYQLEKFQKELKEMYAFKNISSLISAIAGEIGNNSFDHNIGNWPDVRGIFFGYNLDERQIVLADRGQGVLKTLKRVKPDLENDRDALEVAFTKVLSARATEHRGNGLKFVKKIVIDNNLYLSFQSGNAKLKIGKGIQGLNIKTLKKSIRGCLIFIQY